MSRLRSLCVAASLLAGLAAAQNSCPVSTTEVYCPDTLVAVGTCNSIPFGSSAYSYLARIPASFMIPSVPEVTDVAFTPCYTGTFTAPTIQIIMGHVPNPQPNPFQFPTTNLSSLGSFLDATMVYDSTVNGTFSWPVTQDTWSPMNLPTSFFWNGVDDVGFFVTFSGATGTGSMHRTTTEPARSYTASYAAAAATTNLAASGLKMRLSLNQTSGLFQTVVTPIVGGGAILDAQNIPSGASEGYTLVTAATPTAVCAGPLFGITPDFLTWNIFTTFPTASVGNPLHFLTPVPPPFYPGAPLVVPAPTFAPYIGTTWDFVTIVFAPGFSYLGQSTVGRITWM
ncbi:MAG TPA: hypothetical protein VEI02_01815 [Planctomycetota bacterium]|nr:hypothetical protein [Planctomycetota bacterium]